MSEPSSSSSAGTGEREHCCVKCAHPLTGADREGSCPECGTPRAHPLPRPLPETEVPDRYCIRCAYPLVGLSASGMCPECGTSIALSLGESTLANASPEYLRTVRRGLSFVLNGILLMVVAVVGGIVLNGVLVSAGMLAPDAADLLLRGLMFGVSVILTLGYFWYTTPDPGQVARETTRSARVVVRTVVLIQAALSLANLALTFIAGVSPGTANIVEMVVGALWLVTQALWAVQFFAVMRYTRWLATRAPDHFVIRRTRRYMWLLPVLYIPGIALFGLGPLIALVMYWNLLDRLRKHFKAIVKTGRPARLKGMLATGR